MSVRVDPEENETHALFDIVDVANKYILEIGSGDGRLTWRYAEKAAHVTAIGPSKGNYRVGYLDANTGKVASRSDVAAFLLDVLMKDKYIRQMPLISS